MLGNDIEIAFDKLCTKVGACVLCPRMKYSQRVLNHSSGPLDAKIMFIGEAPGRLGADNSGIPFHGDKSGHNFEALLEFAHLDRSKIFVTNAVLCNPRDEDGNNSTPTKIEAFNCSKHLAEQIELINPDIVVTLGSVALESTRLVASHNLVLKQSVRTANKWFNRILIPSYHPGQRAMLHRSFANQRSDYQFIAEQLKRIDKPRKQTPKTSTNIDIALIVEYILTKINTISYFTLHKLFYLIEYKAYKESGSRLTNAYIIRQKDGPYCTDLHVDKLKKAIPDFSYFFKGKVIIIQKNNSNKIFYDSLLNEFDLEDNVKEIIDSVILEHGSKNNTALKRTVYFSRPMRNFLKMEKELQVNLYNSPIIFSEKDRI